MVPAFGVLVELFRRGHTITRCGDFGSLKDRTQFRLLLFFHARRVNS
jgi:hypothetical protein